MATWDDVRRLVAALPDTDEHASYGGCPSWRVHGKAFVWDRPLRSADRRALAEAAPDETEPLLGIRVADEGVKAGGRRRSLTGMRAARPTSSTRGKFIEVAG